MGSKRFDQRVEKLKEAAWGAIRSGKHTHQEVASDLIFEAAFAYEDIGECAADRPERLPASGMETYHSLRVGAVEISSMLSQGAHPYTGVGIDRHMKSLSRISDSVVRAAPKTLEGEVDAASVFADLARDIIEEQEKTLTPGSDEQVNAAAASRALDNADSEAVALVEYGERR